MTMYRCPRCEEEKPLAAFARQPKKLRSAWCLKCRAVYMKVWRGRKTPAQRSEQYRRENLKRLFGISPEQYDSMLAAQGGVCAICGGPPTSRRYHVDHDHKTGEVRGILCHGCNTGLGAFKDSAQLMAKAISYLAKVSSTENVA